MKIILAVLFIIPGIVFGNDFNWDAYISQKLKYLSENHAYDERYSDFEAGFRYAVDLNDIVDFRVALKYEPAFPDGTPLDVEFVVLDLHNRADSVESAGVRCGRLQIPYSIHGSNWYHPVDRIGVDSPTLIIWPNNRAIYLYGDGCIGYVSLEYIGVELLMEYGNLTHNKPQPQLEYTRGNSVVLDSLDVDILNLELTKGVHRLRVDVLKPIYNIEVTQNTYEQQFSSYPGITGNFTQTFELYYLGYEGWLWDKWNLIVESVWFNYTCKGSDRLFYQQFGMSSICATIRYSNILIGYSEFDSWASYMGYSWTSKGDPFDSENPNGVNYLELERNRGTEYYVYAKKKFDSHWVLKFQYSKFNTTDHLTLTSNPDKLQQRANWYSLAMSLSYVF